MKKHKDSKHNRNIKLIEINEKVLTLSPPAIALFRKMLLREEAETRKAFEVVAHWSKPENEEFEHMAERNSIKPLTELENFIRTQEMMNLYKRKKQQQKAK
ncbi:hypothetical protein [Vibrio algivorus]|uniref:Uncharacterized protein n=1 Tax=Vibrio algivorus TaxID=1667024 RepID=A0A557P6B8_9VIBR|nr:hypothetical protein [Vibrio algivorus]TVO36205.1 hypothetical protein FOF44_09850 [Vibrio algivorus]